jgi:hypothetical protein
MSTPRRCPAAAPSRGLIRSSREAYPRRVRKIELVHTLGTEGEQPLAYRRRVSCQRGNVDRLARWDEWAQALDAFLNKNGRAVEVAAAPMVKADANLEDAVIQITHGRGRVAPQQLERLVLLEELARVELLDAAQERCRWRFGAAGAGGLVGCAGGLSFRRARRFARAATWLGRARIR